MTVDTPLPYRLSDLVKLIDEAMGALEDATLIDRRQMQHLFPDATICTETFLGFAKSFTAIRHTVADETTADPPRMKTAAQA